MESGACTCLPGQGLRYLEHLCLVLEQMVRLQQLYLQLQTQRPSRVSDVQVQVARSVREESGGRVGPLEHECLLNSLSFRVSLCLFHLACLRILRRKYWLQLFHHHISQTIGSRSTERS